MLNKTKSCVAKIAEKKILYKDVKKQICNLDDSNHLIDSNT